jgi:hypothetical protein
MILNLNVQFIHPMALRFMDMELEHDGQMKEVEIGAVYWVKTRGMK